MWIILIIIVALLILYIIYQYKEDEKERIRKCAVQLELDYNRQDYNRSCIDVKINYKEAKLTADEAWEQLKEIGDKYNIPEDERTTSLQGAWSGRNSDGRPWVIKDEPGWEQNIPED